MSNSREYKLTLLKSKIEELERLQEEKRELCKKVLDLTKEDFYKTSEEIRGYKKHLK